MEVLFSQLCAALPDYRFSGSETDFRLSNVQLLLPDAPEAADVLYLSDSAPAVRPTPVPVHIVFWKAAPGYSGCITADGDGSFGSFLNAVITAFQQLISSPDRITERVSVLARCTNLQQYLEVSSELLHAPLLLADVNAEILAHSTPADFHDSAWARLLELNSLPFNLLASPSWLDTKERAATSGLPCVVPLPGSDYSLLLHTVVDAGTQLGLLAAALPPDRLSNFNTELLLITGRLLTRELRARYDQFNAHRSRHDLLLEFLLRGNRYPPQILQQRIQELRWDPGRYKRLYLFHAAEYEANESYFSFSSVVQELPKNLGDHAMIFYSDVVLLQTDDQPLTEGRGIVSEVLRYAAAQRLVVGISREFEALSDLHSCYQQARAALGLGVRFAPEHSVHWYERFAVLHLLERCSMHENLTEYCHPGILQLHEDDLAHGSGYLQTLQCYLDNHRSISRTAELLHIHRNTVSYRVDHCEAICGTTLDAEDSLLHILLSLKILEFQAGGHSPA